MILPFKYSKTLLVTKGERQQFCYFSIWDHIHQWKRFKRWQDLERDNKEYKREQHRIKNTIKLNEDFYISPETIQQDHSIDNVRRVKEYRDFQGLQYDQRYIPDRQIYLGPDLAAAYFIVHRKGAVKFLNDDEWHKRDSKGRYTLPFQKKPGLFLEAIDASNTELMFEGFDNLYDLKHLRLLSLANCKRINDWVLSRLGGIFSDSLEMLDLSDCKRISAKGYKR